MGGRMAYGRVLLKLSGDAFSGPSGGIDRESLDYVARELAEVRRHTQLAVVMGAGNIMRGAQFFADGPGRILADFAGMLGTVINAVMLQSSLDAAGADSLVMSGLRVPEVADSFSPLKADEALREGRIVLLAGGTGNPFFTTDTAAVLRAVQVRAEIVLKATRVDGVYSADPEQDPGAEFFETIDLERVLGEQLGVMDLTAAALCLQHDLPMRVFNFRVPGNILRAVKGEPVGTLVRSKQHGD